MEILNTHTCTNYKEIHAVVDLGVGLALVIDSIGTKVFGTSIPSLDFVVSNPEAIQNKFRYQ